jgi:hypothetical protein
MVKTELNFKHQRRKRLNCYYFSPTSFSRVPVDPRGLAGEEDVGE